MKKLSCILMLCLLLSSIAIGGCSQGRQTPTFETKPVASSNEAVGQERVKKELDPQPAPIQKLQKLIIGYPSRGIYFFNEIVAEKVGLYKEQGFEVEFFQGKSAVLIASLTAGETDYVVSYGSTVRSAAKGLPVKVISTSTSKPQHVLLVRPEIEQLSDLKGKMLGVSAFGATEHRITQLTLQNLGFDPNDVQFIQVGQVPVRLAAMQQGTIHGSSLVPPELFIAEKEGYRILARASDSVDLPLGGLGTTDQKLKNHRDEVKRVIRASIQGLQYMRNNKQATIQIMMDFLNIDREVAEKSYEVGLDTWSHDGSVSVAGLRLDISMVKEESNIPLDQDLPLSLVADFSILREVQQELGLR